MVGEINELTLLFALAAGLGLIAKLFRQPLILAFIATGIIIGAFGLSPVATDPIYRLFADLGIMFLLFLIGMEINFSSLRLVGPASVMIGLGQVVFTFVGGMLIALLLGIEPLPAAYIAIALTFSSTIIAVKLLSEKRDNNSLYGKITIGMLLVQDFVALLILLVLAGVQTGSGAVWQSALLTSLKGLGLFGLMIWLGRMVMPWIFNRVARSQELLFIASLAWLFLTASFIHRLGFSIEIGGFLAGLALANSSEHFQISSRIRPLRDFFLLLFFVILGTSMAMSDFQGLTWPVVVFSLFVLIGNPLIVLVIMGSMGYHRRTSFLTGVTIAQISEFSLVLAALGARLGHLSTANVTLITAVAVITIGISSYIILSADRIYTRLRGWLRWFERRNPKSESPNPKLNRPVVLIGAHRTGEGIMRTVPKKNLAIIDFDPDIVTRLTAQGYTALFGDISDIEIEEVIDLRHARVIVSTSPDFENNLNFLKTIVASWPRRRPLLIFRAETSDEAECLYAAGAGYVFLPALESGQLLGQLLLKPLTADSLAKLRRRTEINRRRGKK